MTIKPSPAPPFFPPEISMRGRGRQTVHQFLQSGHPRESQVAVLEHHPHPSISSPVDQTLCVHSLALAEGDGVEHTAEESHVFRELTQGCMLGHGQVIRKYFITYKAQKNLC